MAIVNDNRIGRVRFKLAQMIAQRFPELRSFPRQRNMDGPVRRCVDPFLLRPQIPIYASPIYDCCSWDADLPLTAGGSYHIYSWDSMTDLVRYGFDVTKTDHRDYELSANEEAKGDEHEPIKQQGTL